MKIPKKNSSKDVALYEAIARMGDLGQEYLDRDKTYKPRSRKAILQEIFETSKEIKKNFK